MVRYLKRLKSSRLGRVQAFPMYGGLGMSAPSLHRESTDSLIGWCIRKRPYTEVSFTQSVLYQRFHCSQQYLHVPSIVCMHTVAVLTWSL